MTGEEKNTIKNNIEINQSLALFNLKKKKKEKEKWSRLALNIDEIKFSSEDNSFYRRADLWLPRKV